MKKFDATKQKYLEKGMKENNIEYAIDAVKSKVKRELIIENLTSNYRNELPEVSNLLLNDIYEADGGEFKYINRGGVFYGILILIGSVIGLIFYFYIESDDYSVKLIIYLGMIIVCAIAIIIKGIFKKYKKDVWDLMNNQ